MVGCFFLLLLLLLSGREDEEEKQFCLKWIAQFDLTEQATKQPVVIVKIDSGPPRTNRFFSKNGKLFVE